MPIRPGPSPSEGVRDEESALSSQFDVILCSRVAETALASSLISFDADCTGRLRSCRHRRIGGRVQVRKISITPLLGPSASEGIRDDESPRSSQFDVISYSREAETALASSCLSSLDVIYI